MVVNIPLTDEYQVGCYSHTSIGVTAAAASTAMPLPWNIGVDLACSSTEGNPDEQPICENGRPCVCKKQNAADPAVVVQQAGLRSETAARRGSIQHVLEGGSGIGGAEAGLPEIGYPDAPTITPLQNGMIQMRIFQTTYTYGPIGATGWMSWPGSRFARHVRVGIRIRRRTVHSQSPDHRGVG